MSKEVQEIKLNNNEIGPLLFEEKTLLQRFRGRAKGIAKIMIFMSSMIAAENALGFASSGKRLTPTEQIDKYENKSEDPFEKLSGEEFFYILQWREDARYKPLFSFVYDEYKEKNPDISKKEFYEELKSLDVQGVKSVLEEYALDDNFYDEDFVKNYEKAIDILQSEEFKDLFDYLEETIQISQARNPHYEVFKILKQDKFTKQKYLEALASPEFHEFNEMLKTDYGVNSNNYLSTVVDYYLNPDKLYQLEDQHTQKAFGIFRKYFPDLDQGANQIVDTIFLMDTMALYADQNAEKKLADLALDEFERIVERKAYIYNHLKRIYGFEAKSYYDWQEFVSSKNAISILLRKQTQDIFYYFQNKYPRRVNYKSFYDLLSYKGLSDLASLFLEIKESTEVIDNFLSIFGSSLGEIEFQAYVFRDFRAAINFEHLSKNNDFINYVEDYLSKYPELRLNLSMDIIAKITKNYLFFRAGVEELNQTSLFQEFGVFDINGDYAGYKLSILRKIEQAGFIRIIPSKDKYTDQDVGVYWGIHASREYFLPRAEELMESGEARSLYNSLLNHWEVDFLELGHFIDILNDEDRRGLFMNKENADKYLEIKEKYGLIAKEKNKDIITLKSLDFDVDDLILNYEFLMDDKIFSKIKKYFFSIFNKQGKNIKYSKLLDNVLPYKKIIEDPDFLKIATVLETDYAIEVKDVFYLIEDLNNLYGLQKSLEIVKDQRLKDLYHWFIDFYSGDQNVNKDTLLFCAFKSYSYPRTKDDFENLRKIGFSGFNRGGIAFVLDKILSHKDIVEFVCYDNFPDFYLKIAKTFYDGLIAIDEIEEAGELFKILQGNPDQMELLFSDQFRETISFIRKEFNITNLDIATFFPILKIAEKFDQKEYLRVIGELKKRGEFLSANDLILIKTVVENNDLEDLVFNRDKLANELKPIYDRPYFNRSHLDQIKYLEARLESFKKHKTSEQIRKEKERIEGLKKGYTERLPIEAISNLQMLRLYLLQKALKDEKFLKQIGKLISDDTRDKTTEYGGSISFKKGGLLKMESIRSHSEFDGEFDHIKYDHFIGGVLSFHMHALDIDNSKYSGPSGWLYARRGDITYVDLYNQTDVVITTMGHPPDGDLNKFVVNLDMYWVDKRKIPKRAMIIDLGKYVVPLVN
jgi:hypothetical protein